MTAEIAISLPAVLLVLTLAIQGLSVPLQRMELAARAGEQARAIARGQAEGGNIEGKLVCVTLSASGLLPLKEEACARRLGL
ncbi:MAG: hypothetical protein RL683_181 [Actinomycetota bacterium]